MIEHGSDHNSEHEHHIVPVKVYIAVFASLLTLTGITVFIAYVDLGPLNLAVAISIAMLKTTLVILYFMHVRYGSHLVKVFVCAGFLWFLIMVSIMMSDYMTRGWIGTPRGWQ